MPAVLTHKTIMLLTRERLARIRDMLRAKLDTTRDVTDLEYRVWYLAKRAHELMSESADTPPAIRYPTNGSVYPSPLGQGVSRFSVMGSMGPDIPAFSSFFSRGQAWVFDTVHKGNPDSHRELVVAKTHTFVLELWQAVRRAVADGSASDTDSQKLAAYVLGHLCHVAGDVISHPFINDLEWHSGYVTREKFSHAGGEGSIDAKVARQVLLRGSTREGQDWDVWWPTVDEVPRAFFPAYVDALERTYFRERSARPTGFGGFEAEFQELQPPSLTVDFLRDGYKFYRNGVVTMGYGWGIWRWFGFLTPLMLPLMAIAPLVVALPHSRQFLERELEDVDERAWFELLMMPAVLGLIPMAFYGIWLAAITTSGVGGLHAFGLTHFGLSLIPAIAFLATLKTQPEPLTRWLLMLAPVGLVGLALAIKGFVDKGKGDTGRMALDFIYAMPFLFALVAMVLVLLLVSTFREGDAGLAGFIILLVLLTGGALALWIGLPWFLRSAKIPEHPEAFPAERKHFVRLFDDSTLFSLPTTAAPSLGNQHYPSGRRALLKLWWEGPGDLFIRSEQSRLDFSFTGTGEPARTVPAPIVPMSARDFAQFLTQTFEGPGGERNKLKAALFHATDADRDYELPTGATFSEELDAGADTEHGLPDSVAAWHPIGTTQDNTKYVLRHADKPFQSVRFGTMGPVGSVAPEDDAVGGPGKIVSSGTSVHGVGTGFDAFFEPGDRLESKGQVRTVVDIVSETLLHVDSAFDPPISLEKYQRVGPREEPADGYTYVTNPHVPPGVVGGDAIMDLAADLGALLCMGMTPHLISDAQLAVPGLTGKLPVGSAVPVDPNVSRVFQVFRNWSLDRRRLNEWRMLVAGGANSEKGGNVASYDDALPQPNTGWVPPRAPDGEPVSNAQGWIPVLRQWLEQTTVRSCTGPTVPGQPTADELGQALAYLLDLPKPVNLQ